jgi:uncharacterized protein YqhQ
MAVKLYLYFGLENQRTLKRVTFHGSSLFLFSTYHKRRQIKKNNVTNFTSHLKVIHLRSCASHLRFHLRVGTLCN